MREFIIALLAILVVISGCIQPEKIPLATTPTPTAIITPQPTAKPEKPVAEQICERIKSLEERTSCLAAVKKDPNLCGPLSEYYKQPCLNRLLLTSTSEELCESFKENKPLCMAYARRDYTFCAEWVYSDYCYEGIAALTGNPTICILSPMRDIERSAKLC